MTLWIKVALVTMTGLSDIFVNSMWLHNQVIMKPVHNSGNNCGKIQSVDLFVNKNHAGMIISRKHSIPDRIFYTGPG